MLAGLAQKQEKILQEQGPVNPLVTMEQYHNTLTKMTELSGFKDTQSFWSNPKDFQPPPPEPPEPTPDEIFATAQADKVRADIELDKQKFGLDQEKMIRDDDLQRDKLDSDVGLKTQEMENKYKTSIDMTEIKGNNVHKTVLAPDCKQLAVCSKDTTLQIWDVAEPSKP